MLIIGEVVSKDMVVDHDLVILYTGAVTYGNLAYGDFDAVNSQRNCVERPLLYNLINYDVSYCIDHCKKKLYKCCEQI
ncbi:hypothetical protein PHET_03598 [Paragonimus heterotremus]|uniref:Uncharacterized protein n=1 Tax=Paragonimus heterotremus TaxID=100268 RepID=A0A8J4SR23_9TREM|nr:hypothetical protein PHET_03598 [Paragonimus heterotremus]